MKTNRVVTALCAVVLLTLAVPAGAGSNSDSLPGGTDISVSIDDPVTSTDFLIPIGETTLDVPVIGTASVGEGEPVKDTTIVYVMDRSGSMSLSAGVDCDGDAFVDTRLTCEQVGVAAANTAAADPNSTVDETGLASFADTATAHDVDLGTAGDQLIVASGHDGNLNGTPDVEDVANSLSAFGLTNYHDGLSAALTILGADTNPVNVVIFMSDGANNIGSDVSTLAGSVPANTTIHSFAIGTGVSCTSDPLGLGSLQDVADLSTTGMGSCTQVTDLSTIADVIAEAVGSTLDALEIAVDAGPSAAIPNSEIDPDLPQDGPTSVDYATTAEDLGVGDREICVTAFGTDAGGSGDVTRCETIHLIQLVGIDIKPGSDPNAINSKKEDGVIPLALLGSATFDVTNVDVTTLEFDAESAFPGASPFHDLTDPAVLADHTQDVNGDGWMDLVSHYRTGDTDIAPGDTVACLTGEFLGGGTFEGCDAIKVVR